MRITFTKEEIARMAYKAGYEGRLTDDLDPKLSGVPEEGQNWLVWARNWKLGALKADEPGDAERANTGKIDI